MENYSLREANNEYFAVLTGDQAKSNIQHVNVWWKCTQQHAQEYRNGTDYCCYSCTCNLHHKDHQRTCKEKTTAYHHKLYFNLCNRLNCFKLYCVSFNFLSFYSRGWLYHVMVTNGVQKVWHLWINIPIIQLWTSLFLGYPQQCIVGYIIMK